MTYPKNKIVLCTLLFALILSLSACSKSETKPAGQDSGTSAETSESKSTSSESSSNSDASNEAAPVTFFDNAGSWTISIDGEDYTFPIKYEEFVSKADWEIYSYAKDSTLYPNLTNSKFSAVYEKTGTKFDVVFANFNSEKCDYTEGYIVGIHQSFGAMKSDNDAMPTIVLPMGFVFNEEPSLDDIMAAWGTASEGSENSLVYSTHNDDYTMFGDWKLGFASEDGKLYTFEMLNFNNPESN